MAWLPECVAGAALLFGIVSGASGQVPSPGSGSAPDAKVPVATADTIHSFEALRSSLIPQQVARATPIAAAFGFDCRSTIEVKVKDANGHVTTGTFVSISDSELVLSRPRFFRKNEERAFARDTIAQVQRVDSVVNGLLLGLGVGLVLPVVKLANTDDLGEIEAGVYALSLFGTAGAIVGALIDERLNKTIYERPPQRSVTLVPIAGTSRLGVIARVRF